MLQTNVYRIEVSIFHSTYAVRNELGLALVDLAQRAEVMGDDEQFQSTIDEAIETFQQVLEIDSENVTAHANLAEVFAGSAKRKGRRNTGSFTRNTNRTTMRPRWRFPSPDAAIPRQPRRRGARDLRLAA